MCRRTARRGCFPSRAPGVSLESLAKKFVPDMSLNEVLVAITRHGEATVYQRDKVALVGGSVLGDAQDCGNGPCVAREPDSAIFQYRAAQRVPPRREQGTWSLRATRLRCVVGASNFRNMRRSCAPNCRTCAIAPNQGLNSRRIRRAASAKRAALAFLSSVTTSIF